MSTLHAFDFDGTITTSDTLLLFIRHARGRWALLWALFIYSPLLILMKLGLADNGKTKERLFGHFFGGMLERDFNTLCESFARSHADIFRTEALKTIEQALEQGSYVVVLSASIDRWVSASLSPFIGQHERFVVLGTQIEVVDGHLTGRFSTPNCYGAEKVRRLRSWMSEKQGGGETTGNDEETVIIAYGDSRGDRELLAIASEAHYKPFR